MQSTETFRRNKKLLIYIALGASVVVAVAVLLSFSVVRTQTKWLLRSHRYKPEVLAQPAPTTGELKHIEWDGWGWAGQDTTVYLVFDPTDSLSAAARNHRPGKFNGIPCEVALVRRLESNWYSVQFYTNEFWGRRNQLNCSGTPN